MSLTTFTTQRQLMQKNMPASALDNPFAQQQKMLMYVLPLFFAISGVNFPIGVLIYWLTTNVWSMGQQFYVIRRMPAPGSPGRAGARGPAGAQGRQGQGRRPTPPEDDGPGTADARHRWPGSVSSRSGTSPARSARARPGGTPNASTGPGARGPGGPDRTTSRASDEDSEPGDEGSAKAG